MGSEGVRSLITLQIQLASNRIKFPFQTELDPTVEEFKLLLSDLTGIPPDQQQLVYKGHNLKNPQTLRSYGLFLFSFNCWFNFLNTLGNLKI